MKQRRATRAATCALALILPLAAAPAAAQDALSPAAEYARLTERYTTAAYTTDELRALGQSELERIGSELRAVMQEVGFDGSVEDFWNHLRTDDRFYYPDTADGRAAYLADAARIVAEIEARVGELVDLPPSSSVMSLAPLQVGATPEGTAPVIAGGYNAPTEDGAPGTLRFNLADMRSAPKFQMAAIAYHEGVPGHHLQMSVARDRPAGGPPQSGSGAFFEGWAHYAERLPLELDLYRDPYANAGRLGLEAWRAARLLADIGLAVDGWSRDRAIAFMLANTPLSQRQATLEIDRCIARPASTSVYIIGKVAFVDLRARAEAALGEAFDVRAFHYEALRHGPVSLPELEGVVDAWIEGALSPSPQAD